MISIIVPTYQEVENLAPLSEMIQSALLEAGENAYEIIIMDDDSQDGSIEKVAELVNQHPIKIVTRTENRGLSPAVIDGFSGNLVLKSMEGALLTFKKLLKIKFLKPTPSVITRPNFFCISYILPIRP